MSSFISFSVSLLKQSAQRPRMEIQGAAMGQCESVFIYNQLRFSHNASELSFWLQFVVMLLHVFVSNDISLELQIHKEKIYDGRVSKLHFQNSKTQKL